MIKIGHEKAFSLRELGRITNTDYRKIRRLLVALSVPLNWQGNGSRCYVLLSDLRKRKKALANALIDLLESS